MDKLKPKPHFKSLKLMIPDTVFYHRGNAKFMVYNAKNREFIYVK
mgnify:CR=1 FL=1